MSNIVLNSTTGSATASKKLKPVTYTYIVNGKSVTQTAAQAKEAAVKANTTLKSILKDVIKPSIQKTVTPATRINTTRLNLQTKVNKLVDTFKVVYGSLAERVKGVCELFVINNSTITSSQGIKDAMTSIGGVSTKHNLIKIPDNIMDEIRESIKNNMNDTNPKYIQALMDYYKKQFDYGLISKSAYDDSMRVLSNKLDIANRYQYNLDIDNVF